MKLMMCLECGDVVRLSPKLRACQCGASQGRYVDNANTVQTPRSLSLGLHNHDLRDAVSAFFENQTAFGPQVWIRAWINPTSEPDVRWAEEIPPEPDEE